MVLFYSHGRCVFLFDHLLLVKVVELSNFNVYAYFWQYHSSLNYLQNESWVASVVHQLSAVLDDYPSKVTRTVMVRLSQKRISLVMPNREFLDLCNASALEHHTIQWMSMAAERLLE
jgi:hypothetical protein